MWLRWLAGFISGILRNPVETQALLAIIAHDPQVPRVVKDDLAVAFALGGIFANKKPGALVYKFDDGSPEQIIVHVAP